MTRALSLIFLPALALTSAGCGGIKAAWEDFPAGAAELFDPELLPAASGHEGLRDVPPFAKVRPDAQTYSYHDTDGEDYIARTFRLTCAGEPVTEVPLSIHAEGRTRAYIGDKATGTYQVRIRRGGGITVTVPAGVQGDLCWDDFSQTWSDFDLIARETPIALRGTRFDGRYLAEATLNTASSAPRNIRVISAAERFIPFRTKDLRPDLEGKVMIYDRLLRCVWYYPNVEPRTYDDAAALAADCGGEIPTLDDLTTLLTQRAIFCGTYLHPAFVIYGGMADVRVWAEGGRQCVVFRRRYAPRVNAAQPSATLLIKLPEALFGGSSGT